MKNLLIFLLISTTSFAQNKKEQIEALNHSVDSLNTVLATTKDNSAKDIRELNDYIKKVRDELTNLQTSNNKLSKENEKFKTDLGELSKKNLELEAKLEAEELKKTSFKTVKVGNLEVWPDDLGKMKWDEAIKACKNLGYGWRLPTEDELNVLYENKDKIGGFTNNYYWSSTKGWLSSMWMVQNFGTGTQDHASGKNDYGIYVRAVRAF
jgi:cell division protein FtsB